MTTNTPTPNMPALLIAEVLEAVAAALRRGEANRTAVADRDEMPTMVGTKLLVSVSPARGHRRPR